MNTLYYYNCKEKIDATKSKLEGEEKDKKKGDGDKGDKKKKKKHTDPEEEDADSIGDQDSVAQELTKEKALQSIDDAAYTVHYVLSALGRRDLRELFVGTSY